MKQCTTCKTTKSLDSFQKRTRAKDGLQARCKDCMNEYNQKHYYLQWSKNRKRVDELHKKKMLKYRDEVNKIKCDKGCIVCKYNEYPVVLDFHHIDPNTKTDTISCLINKNCTKERLHAEIEKCVIVCANCHRLLHANIISLQNYKNLSH